MYEYRTASFFVNGRSHGHPLEEVDKFIGSMQAEGWEFVELTQSALSTGISVILLFRKHAT
jgi:hypothetical protein